ncbi:MAG TPA: Rad52/Rad22 family DNA repair protein, partial [Pyrinomonadaceae bacterium]|nr:Rad52/Rad22 family DNA repair protein [Pyrinomonadaceae bacterium]
VNLFLRGLKPDQPPVSTNQIPNTEVIHQNMSNHQSNKNTQKRENGLSSYSEAKTFEEALQMFNRETPSGLILDIPRRNSKGDDYIEWHTVAEILDIVFPRWTHSIKEIKQIEKFVSVTVVITIDGVSREGLGTGEATSEQGIKKAEHDALKRAAVKFGIARDLRVKDEDSHPAFKNQNNQNNRNNRNNNSSNSYQGNNSNRNQANNSASQNNFPSNVSQINPKLATNDQLQELVKLQREINTQFDKKLFAPDEFMNRFKTTAGGQGVPRTVTRQQVEEVTRDFQMIKQSCLKEAAKLQEKAG